jgi:hypothetical protein
VSVGVLNTLSIIFSKRKRLTGRAHRATIHPIYAGPQSDSSKENKS